MNALLGLVCRRLAPIALLWLSAHALPVAAQTVLSPVADTTKTAQPQPETAQPQPETAQPQPETAQPQPAIADEFASPLDTIHTFLVYANQAAEDSENETALLQVYRTMDLPESTGAERGNMAVKLLGVFNALGKVDAAGMAPGREEVKRDRLSRFEFFPDNPYPAARALIRRAIFKLGNTEPPGKIVLTRTESGEWKFSSDSMDVVGELWSWIEVLGVQHGIDVRDLSAVERIRARFIPEALKGSFFLGIELWQWVGLILIAFLSVLVDRLVRLALRPMVRWLTILAVGHTDAAGERATLRPLGLLAGVLVFVSLLRGLGLVGEAAIALVVSLKLVFIFSAAWTAWAVADLLAAASLHGSRKRELTIDNMIIPLLRRTAKLVIVVFALLYTAHALDINLLPLLGSVGIAGLAISFAAQDMVKNLFGGLTVFLDRPFKTGDRVKYGGYDGMVEYIGFRSTKISTFAGHTVTIPNGVLTGEAVENVSTRTTIMHSFNVPISLQTPTGKVEQAVQIIRDILDEDGIREAINPVINGDVWAPLVKFDKFNADSLNIFVIYWHEPPSWSAQMDHTQRLNLRVLESFRAAGIEFALPTHKVHLAGDQSERLAVNLTGPAPEGLGPPTDARGGGQPAS